MAHDERPIGIFDSGVGGLTVFQEIARLMPQENLVYFGDTARLPYGNKSPDAIVQYTMECARFLLSHNIKLLVIACHTASSHALPILQQSLSIPVFGVVQPGFECLMQATRTHRVAILATTATISSSVYQNLIRQRCPDAVIFPIACPLFVALAEEQLFESAAADLIAEHYLQPLQAERIDTALLACTHFPLLRKAIEKTLPQNVKIIEPASLCAQQIQEFLCASQLTNQQSSVPTHHFFASDHHVRFSTLAKTFLSHSINPSSPNVVLGFQ
jgi:glutamate racemase